MRFVRRFVAIGTLATACDVGLVLLLSIVIGWRPWLADAVAITVATLVSFFGHQHVSFAASPRKRWYRRPARYAVAASMAGLADVAVVAFLTREWTEVVVWSLLLVKLLSLTVAFLTRIVLFRRDMFDAIRADQLAPVDRPDPPGSVRLSLVIPAFGEEDGIAQTIERIEAALGHLRSAGGFQLIVVDDGSADDTAGAARAAGADTVLRLENNSGKGAAVRAGVLAATGRCVAFTDADLSYSPEQVLGLMDEVERGWDCVFGSRQHDDTRTLVEARRLREIGGRVINFGTSIVLLGQYRDTQCGLKAFRSDVARVLFERTRINGFAFDVEVFHLVERYRFTLLEVPVEVANATRSTVHVARDAARLVRDLFRIRLDSRAGRYDMAVEDLPPTLRSTARTSVD